MKLIIILFTLVIFHLIFMNNSFSLEQNSSPKQVDKSIPNKKEINAKEIVKKIDSILRGKTSIGTVTMEIKTKHFNRSLTMNIWTSGTDNTLIKIEKPEKENGVCTLKVDNNIWNYLPKVNRVMKLPS